MENFYLATGKRKNAIARVRIKMGSGKIVINGQEAMEYFQRESSIPFIEQPLELTENMGKFNIKVNLKGGGYTGQAEALRLGISRALVKIDAEYRPVLKEKGLMKRDPRMVERKKPGQPKARKKFQFSKR